MRRRKALCWRCRDHRARGAAIAITTAIGCGALAFTTSPSAAVTIGATGGNGSAECPPDYTWAQDSTAVGSPTYAVPAGGGVITSWSHDRGPALATARLRLKVFRKTGAPNNYLTVGESDFETLAAMGVNTFATRVPVEGGDILGFRITTDPVSCRRSGSTGDKAVASGALQPDPPIGSPVAFGEVGAYLLNLAATVEPDADHDGFGDETQDQCPTNAGTQGACPVSPIASDTNEKKCKKKKKRHSAETAKKKCKKKKRK